MFEKHKTYNAQIVQMKTVRKYFSDSASCAAPTVDYAMRHTL